METSLVIAFDDDPAIRDFLNFQPGLKVNKEHCTSDAESVLQKIRIISLILTYLSSKEKLVERVMLRADAKPFNLNKHLSAIRRHCT